MNVPCCCFATCETAAGWLMCFMRALLTGRRFMAMPMASGAPCLVKRGKLRRRRWPKSQGCFAKGVTHPFSSGDSHVGLRLDPFGKCLHFLPGVRLRDLQHEQELVPFIHCATSSVRHIKKTLASLKFKVTPNHDSNLQ